MPEKAEEQIVGNLVAFQRSANQCSPVTLLRGDPYPNGWFRFDRLTTPDIRRKNLEVNNSAANN